MPIISSRPVRLMLARPAPPCRHCARIDGIASPCWRAISMSSKLAAGAGCCVRCHVHPLTLPADNPESSDFCRKKPISTGGSAASSPTAEISP